MAALLKGISLLLMGLWVFGSTAYQVLVLGLPQAEIMGAIGLLALAANLASVVLLMRYKDGDANVRSVWLCSRNDAIGNVAVMVAMLSPSLRSSNRSARTRAVWTRAEVRRLVFLVALFVVHVTASALYVLGG